MKKSLYKYYAYLFLLLFYGSLYGGSYFAYSTTGKSPGLRFLGGSARTNATAFGLLASPDLFTLDSRNFAAWSDRYVTQLSVSFTSDAYFLTLDNGQTNNWGQLLFTDLSINIPILKGDFSLGFGLAPVTNSTIGFSVSGDIGQVIQRFTGNISDGYLTVNYRIYKNLRASSGILYSFGNLTDEFKVITTDELYLNNFTALHEYRLTQPSIVLGISYSDTVFSASGQAIIPFSGSYYHKETNPSNDYASEKKDFSMPLRLSGGLAYASGSYKIGIAGLYENWGEGFKVANNNFPSDLTDYLYLGIGLETTPPKNLFANAISQISWRFGGFGAILNNKDYYSVIKEYGLSVGMGLPFNQYLSNFGFAFTGGVRGEKSINLAEEYFLRLTISFTAGERWFLPLDQK